MAVKLSFDERKWLLKYYWKVENFVEVQRRWRVEFVTPTPTSNKGNNSKNLRQVWSRWNGVRCVERSVRKKEKFHCYGVPAAISRFNPSRLLPLGNFKEHGVPHKSQTLEELRDQIEHAISDIPLATIQTVCHSVRRCCWECTVAEGGNFEHARC